ncbi:MAG: BTAD domain-containing putative transcriptional regulator [Chloroflexi bacterium]|nr:BTAD domain-containing putative transcriptional regulator [Chloroflexota bacterium]
MNNLAIFLFGQPQFFVDGVEVTAFNTRKDRALLAYLAVTGTRHSREALAGLLWPELPEASARRNLRHALSHLQKVVGPQWFTLTRGVALTEEHSWSVDVHALQSSVKKLMAQDLNDTEATEAFNQVLQLYRGEFLQGFYLQHAAHFEEWILAQREELRLLMLQGLEALVERCLRQGAYAVGLAATRRLLQLEPWSEPAHCLQMQLLAQSGRRADALTQYEACRKILAAELGVEPLPTTTALYHQIQTGTYTWLGLQRQEAVAGSLVREPPPTAQKPVVDRPAIPHNLLAPLAKFVGRQTELAFISQRLGASDCRLLTIVGPGGMGKSSLALAAGQRLLNAERTDFPDGIFWVSLAEINPATPESVAQEVATDATSKEAILRAITAQIEEQLGERITSAAQLQIYLRPRRLLLILDNFEHLLAEAAAVVTLLIQAPQIKVLITSRARLNVRGESVLTLDPLSLPTNAYRSATSTAQANPNQAIQDEVWQTSEAIAMFVQRAQQLDATFAINAATIGPVGQICQLVEGLPLGIELATSLLPSLDCTKLAAELTKSLDFLAADIHDLPQEQRTLRAVFERSWRLLSPEGQLLLARLSIFPGSFRREAAEAIVGASISLLKRLLDQSLVSRVIGEDRYTLHRTVHAFAQQKLEEWPEQIEALHVQYAHFYLTFLANTEQGLTGIAYAAAAQQIQVDLDNVQTAWRRAVTHQMITALNGCFHTIHLFYEQQGFYLDSIALYEYALVHFWPIYEQQHNRSASSPALNLLIGRLQTHFGWCNLRLGRFPQALAAYESGWSILQKEDSPIAAAVCLALWGASIKMIDPQQSAKLLDEALHLAQASGVEWLQTLIGQAFGETLFLLGDYAGAKAHLAAGYSLAKRLNWPRGLTSGAKSLGRVNLSYGYYRQAEEYLRAASGFAGQHHLKILGLESTIALGEALRLQGRLDEARLCFVESRQKVTTLGSNEFMAPVLWEEGCLAEQVGDYQTAKARFTESLAIGIPMWWSHVLPTLGWALVGLGEWEEAQTYFQKALTNADAQSRLAIRLDAQVGLAYLTTRQVSQACSADKINIAESVATVFQQVYQHPAATQETRNRIAKLATALGIPLDEATAYPLSMAA